MEPISKLVQLVASFERLDACIFDELLKANNFAALDQALEAKREIKRFLARHKSIKVHSPLTAKLKKIRDNYGYNLDRVVDALNSISERKISPDAEDDKDYVDALFSEGTADYVDEHFFRRRNQAATVIVGQSFPDLFLDHLGRLQECYALGLFHATVIYCRAVIEAAGFEALRRRGKIRPQDAVDDIREFSLKAVMNSIRPFAYPACWNAAMKVKKLADDLLHSKRKRVEVSEHQAFEAIKSTFALVEDLFK